MIVYTIMTETAALDTRCLDHKKACVRQLSTGCLAARDSNLDRQQKRHHKTRPELICLGFTLLWRDAR